MRPSLIVMFQKVCCPTCVSFFLVLVYLLEHQIHAEEKISLLILEDLFVGFHCFSGRHLFAREVRGEERKSACRSLCTEEDDRSSIVSLHFLRWRARRLMLHRAFCASAAAGAFCSLAIAFLSCPAASMSSLISCSALCVYVMVASGLFQSSSLAKKANGSECLQGCTHSVAFSSQFQSDAIWLCKLTRADCLN